jgi:hypothetical protein
VRRILAPAALPSYITGLRAGLALGWMFVIAAELMGRVFQEVAVDLPRPRRRTTAEFQAIKEEVTVHSISRRRSLSVAAHTDTRASNACPCPSPA